MPCLHVIVHGRVQGVGFRYFARHEARQRRLTGWVRNRPDGTVEAAARGSAPDLEHWIAALRSGPPAARVDRIERDEREIAGADDEFAIVD
ncbi:MAG: acylphosphatase [Candidatus Eisenbacteria bacterium]|uniref:Acylphosphatase n=1 Tax=Eiseniibacteriota bacterium TaxID=2212470 RepID=A0A849SYD8_UNCEI|nr:acylphosphatase [Candidatus Eisenbacteria bacterium]